MDSIDNKFAIILPEVTITPTLDRCLLQVEEACKQRNFKMYITSGKRSEEHQMRIIRNYAVIKGLAKAYQEAMICKHDEKGEDGFFKWQKLWSKLCNIGLIIAPPISAVALYDYNYFGRNLKGLVCPSSNHIPGYAWDADGGENGIDDETEVINWGIKKGIITYITNIVPERNNNCLHANCKPI